MKSHIALAVSLALAVAAPAFAQDSSQAAPPASQANDQAAPDQSAPADSSSMSSDTQQTAPTMKRHHRHAMQTQRGPNGYNPAAERLNGNEPGVAAYQASDGDKYRHYPAVDHGHVAGDPPVIDHSGDHAPVANPTAATITVPPTH